MQNTGPLVRTKLHLPFLRLKLVLRTRLKEQVAQGLRGPLTLITAPAGFGKTTLVASCVTGCGMPAAWLSLDKDDNQAGRFLSYLVATLQEADRTVGSEAAQLLESAQQTPPETILTSLINDLEIAQTEMILVLDDYQFISSQAVHEQVAFLLEHCPNTFHMVIATRSDPPLPLSRLRARGQTVELRAADLRFSEPEAAQFLNDVMGLRLDERSIAALEERTEGWIAGLQMAALSMRDRKDVYGFIEGFSGTNRYILDYLLEEVLASQPPEIQRFLLYTSILDRLTTPLCDAILAAGEGSMAETGNRSTGSKYPLAGQSASTLEYLERANLFLIPLDDDRIWYRYHHLFADLLRTQLQRTLGNKSVAQLHVCASDWHAQNGSILEAIHHASMAADDERVERFIEQSYKGMVSQGEMFGMRYWIGKLSKEQVYSRPWLCIYEAYSHSWFGELDEAELLLAEAEKRIPPELSDPDALSMQAHLAYVKSRVTAMRGNIQHAIELCLEARDIIQPHNLSLQFDSHVTLGYEYFLNGDYSNASQILNKLIQSGKTAGAIINTVAASCLMARLYAVQGLLKKSYGVYQTAAQLVPETGGQHRDARALVEIGMADVLCEWNDLDAALVHMKLGLALIPLWGKVDDWILANITLARIHLAKGNRSEAIEAVAKAFEFTQKRGVFSEARNAVEVAQVKIWLAEGDLQAANRWAAAQEERLGSGDRFGFVNELAHIARVRVNLAQNRINEAIGFLAHLEETTRSAGRIGRLIEIMILKSLALQRIGSNTQADIALKESLALAEPQGYIRIFLDEGLPMQMLIARWLAHANPNPIREYAMRLLSQFNTELPAEPAAREKATPNDNLVEPLSQRELEVLHLMALGRTNQEIARQIIVAPGTVKAHAASIYRKLDAANRTEAVARARQLGIL